jgi:isopentenyldiphosphate isomerase
MTIQQNDPGELLEVFDRHGRPTGNARSRFDVHIHGYWHQAFHCWIMRFAQQEVVFQQRALAKDTFGGHWDAAAAGHWRFGETAEQAAREIGEELGISVSFGELRYRGRERAARRFANGLIDREFHQVYVLDLDWPLAVYRPDPAEVIGLAAFSWREVLALADGRQTVVSSREAMTVGPDGSLTPREVILARHDLVPYSAARLRRMLGKR